MLKTVNTKIRIFQYGTKLFNFKNTAQYLLNNAVNLYVKKTYLKKTNTDCVSTEILKHTIIIVN